LKHIALISAVAFVGLVGCGDSNAVSYEPTGPQYQCGLFIEWEAPEFWADKETPFELEHLDFYTIYVSRQADFSKRDFKMISVVEDPNLTSYVLSGLQQGKYWVTMTATVKQGDESAYAEGFQLVCN